MELILILILILTVSIYSLRRRYGKKLLPGPPRVPILGSLPFLTTKKGTGDWVFDTVVTQHKIAQISLGPRSMFVINDYDLAKELFDKAEFSGRTPSEFQLVHRYFDRTPQV